MVRAGDVLTYTVIVDNLGPSYANYVALKDVLQSGGVYDLIDIKSDRDAVCVGLPGPSPAVPLARPRLADRGRRRRRSAWTRPRAVWRTSSSGWRSTAA